MTKTAASRTSVGAIAIVAASFLASGCRGRPRAWQTGDAPERTTSKGPVVLELDLTSGAPESGARGVLGMSAKNSFDALVAALHEARGRTQLRGIFVAFGAAPIGWARAHELGAALAAFRKGGTTIVCHADAWDNTSYAAAVRGCDVIAMSPGGEVEATGPAATVPYAHELLVDRLHAQVDVLQVGRFKGAAEPLTRDGPSDEYRASISETLMAIRHAEEDALSPRGLADKIGTGPYMAGEAQAAKLVDLLVDRRGAREEAKKRAGSDAHVELAFGAGAGAEGRPMLLEIARAIGDVGHDATSGPHIRLLRLSGEIVLEGGRGLLGGPSGIIARRLVERAHALADDADVRAVVMRIDSPGGSALGSDLAWIALKELRDKKPLVTSIGEMAASGGYYLASSSTAIFAEPESIVGSIGVVGGKVSFGGPLAMVGVHVASFGDTRAASMGSLVEPWDEATRARLVEGMGSIYSLFLDRVAQGRGASRESFAGAVEGRVFGGVRAKALNLVDDLGGLQEAIDKARTLAGLDASAPLVVDDAGGLLDGLQLEDQAIALAPVSDSGDLGLQSKLESMLSGAAMAAPGVASVAEIHALVRWLSSFARVSEGTGVAAMLPAPLVVR